MSFGNWRSYNEAGRVIVFAAIAAIAIALLVTSPRLLGGPSAEHPGARQRYAGQQHWQPHFSERDSYAPYQNTNCQSPKTTEEADLCQQWRMAEATEKGVALAFSQYRWNIAQSIGTIIAAIATAMAAWAAVRAANAARDTVAETRRIGEAQVRAYISWDGAEIGFGVDDRGDVVHCAFMPSIKNTGQSPANLVGLYSHIDLISGDDTPDVLFAPDGVACGHVIGAGNRFHLGDQCISKDEASEVFSGTRRCYLLGWAAYRDVFMSPATQDHVLTFCFEVAFRFPPSGWTRPIVNDAKSVTLVSLTSRPAYTIRPSGPYK